MKIPLKQKSFLATMYILFEKIGKIYESRLYSFLDIIWKKKKRFLKESHQKDKLYVDFQFCFIVEEWDLRRKRNSIKNNNTCGNS